MLLGVSTSLRIIGTPASALNGSVRVPGDKSISHRAILLGSLAEGVSHISGFLDGADCNATCEVVRGLDVSVLAPSPTERVVHGQGLNGWAEPLQPLDCANSGTTMRLLAGLLAGRAFTTFLVGTPQLMARPMARITDPLAAMGVQVLGRAEGRYAPLAIRGGSVKGGTHALKVASAQVKSCILFAGLYADGPTTVVEPGPCRDHSERILRAMGAPLEIDGARITISPPEGPLSPLELTVPGDPSSAAFLLVAAAILPGSEITLPGVGTNPTRSGLVAATARRGRPSSPRHGSSHRRGLGAGRVRRACG
jgi:3-phosphoshikimate 1-carboxyvinyltransferase